MVLMAGTLLCSGVRAQAPVAGSDMESILRQRGPDLCADFVDVQRRRRWDFVTAQRQALAYFRREGIIDAAQQALPDDDVLAWAIALAAQTPETCPHFGK